MIRRLTAFRNFASGVYEVVGCYTRRHRHQLVVEKWGTPLTSEENWPILTYYKSQGDYEFIPALLIGIRWPWKGKVVFLGYKKQFITAYNRSHMEGPD